LALAWATLPAVATAQVAADTTYIIPASAHAAGAEGTSWLTDVVLHNFGADQVNVDLSFHPSGSDNTNALSQSVFVAPQQSLRVLDIVLSVFGSNSAAGALLLEADGHLLPTSRTYNDAAAGTYGQYIPGFALTAGTVEKEPMRLVQLTANADYRTNIGFANATAAQLDVDIQLFAADGTLLGEVPVSLYPFGYSQLTNIFELVTDEEVDEAFAIITSENTQARYFCYASVVDNSSGDPVYIVPDAVTAVAGTDIYVPASAHTAGVGGTTWLTDLELHNPGAIDVEYEIALLESVTDNSDPEITTSTLTAGTSVRFGDVLDTVFETTGSAALRITPSTGTLIVTSRTYNDAESGTYGQFIPGLAEFQAIRTGDEARLPQLSYSSSGLEGFRTNIGFVNASSFAITAEMELYRGNGELLGVLSDQLLPYEYRQVNDAFSLVLSESMDDGYAVVRTTTAGGAFFAYASVVDNLSGDPVYIPATVVSSSVSRPPQSAPVTTLNPTSFTQIDLAWTSVSDATSYIVLSGGQEIATVSGLRYSHTNLDAGSLYCFGVRGVNASGAGPTSEQRCATTGQSTVILPGDIDLTMQRIPAGLFWMGAAADERGAASNEYPQHQVRLTLDYYMGAYEVTQGQWEAIMGSNPTQGEGPDHPVYSVSWDDIRDEGGFIDRLNQYLAASGQPGAGLYRLPTEAEWEHATRAGSTSRFFFGSALGCDDYCVYCEHLDLKMWWCGNNFPAGTKAVGEKVRSPFGLYDVHGNILEWVEDEYSDYTSQPQTDPVVSGSGQFRVFRGGNWGSAAKDCRSAFRYFGRRESHSEFLGFRLARTD
jgi:formylglycine-generating enzyme required for sulfatase activity